MNLYQQQPSEGTVPLICETPGVFSVNSTEDERRTGGTLEMIWNLGLSKAILISKRLIRLNMLFQANPANCDSNKALFCTQTPVHFRRLYKAFHLNA